MDHRNSAPSLANRLALTISVLSLAVTLLALGVGLRAFFRLSTDQMEEQSRRSLNFLARTYESHLWSLDEGSIRSTSEAIILDKTIGHLEVRDARGRSLFCHDDGGAMLVSSEVEVIHDGQIIGYVNLGFNDSERRRFVSLILPVGGGIVLLVILVQFLGAALLRSFLKRPFNALTDMADRFAAGEYSYPGERVAYREFLPPVSSFKSMAQIIQRQMASLRESEEKFRAIVTNAPIGIYRSSFDGSLLEANLLWDRVFLDTELGVERLPMR